MTVAIHQGRDGQWYVRVVGGNGEVMFASEGYTRRWNAKRAAKRIAKAMNLTLAP